jgi:hypothetical protein
MPQEMQAKSMAAMTKNLPNEDDAGGTGSGKAYIFNVTNGI